MKSRLVKAFGTAVMVGCFGLPLGACNTTKATVDTFVKFTSSTSPDSMFNRDGIVERDHKVPLYTSVVYDNLQQDIARGRGEYLTSLGVLMDVPAARDEAWQQRAQSRYSTLFPDQTTPDEAVVARLRRELGGTDPRGESEPGGNARRDGMLSVP